MTVSPGKKKQSSSARVRKKDSGIRRFTRNILLAVNIFWLCCWCWHISQSISTLPHSLPRPFRTGVPVYRCRERCDGFRLDPLQEVVCAAVCPGTGGRIRVHSQLHQVHQPWDGRASRPEADELQHTSVQLLRGAEKNTHSKMLQLLRKEDPGILCLQEYFVKGDPAAVRGS
jgi:hypothetical protein